MGWNGLDLQDEFSTLLGDTSTAFKAKVLVWINDICRDIASKHSWPSLRFQGSRYTNATTKQQSLLILAPSVPTVALSTGGTLVEGAVYKVGVTFYQGESKTQSRAVESAALTATITHKQIDVSAIPVSNDPLVTDRKIYLKKNSGDYLLVGSIGNNTSTTYQITADTTSLFTPPDFDYIAMVEGGLSLNGTRQLEHRPLDQLNLLFAQIFPVADPQFWSPLGQDRVIMYPIPLVGKIINFTYLKVPNEIFADATSGLELPISLKMVLKTGVKWMGSDFRDRDDQVLMKQRYDSELSEAVSKFGRRSKTPLRVRDNQGNSDGYEVA